MVVEIYNIKNLMSHDDLHVLKTTHMNGLCKGDLALVSRFHTTVMHYQAPE